MLPNYFLESQGRNIFDALSKQDFFSIFPLTWINKRWKRLFFPVPILYCPAEEERVIHLLPYFPREKSVKDSKEREKKAS